MHTCRDTILYACMHAYITLHSQAIHSKMAVLKPKAKEFRAKYYVNTQIFVSNKKNSTVAAQLHTLVFFLLHHCSTRLSPYISCMVCVCVFDALTGNDNIVNE